MKKLIMALLCLMLCVCLVAPTFAADETTVVESHASKVDLKPGDTFTITVKLSEAPLVHSGLIKVTRDSSVIALQNGSAWNIYDESDEDAPYPDINQFNRTSGTGSFAFASEFYPEGVNVLGDIFTLKLKVNADAPVGETTINLHFELANTLGYSFEIDMNVTVNVVCPHANTENRDEVPAKCGVEGFTAGVYCLDCSQYISGHEVIPALNHNEDIVNEVVVKKPTCTDPGEKKFEITCSACGEMWQTVEGIAIDALGHDLDDGVVTKPDCVNDGYTTYTCQREGCTHTEQGNPVPALGHKPAAAVKENVVPATCGTDGSHDEVVYCETCDAELSRTPMVDLATGEHVYAIEHEKQEPNCTEDGYVIMACGCGALDEKEILPATGHKEAAPVIENDVKPDCLNGGAYDTVVYCSVCNVELKRDTTTVDALGHDFDEGVITKPDCLNGGYTTFTCERCGYSEKRDEVSALGHNYQSEITTKPDCENEGVETFTCERCGDSYTEPVDALGHTPGDMVKENIVNATCGTDGSHDEVVYCETCGKELKRENKIDVATGEHVYATEIKREEPTCTEDGYVIMACGCGAEEKTTLSALGHDYDDGVVTTEPNCTEDGVKTFTCGRCGDSYTEPVNALGHKEAAAVKENDVAPTCDAAGSYDTVVYCSVCGAELSRVTTTVSALGHKGAAAVKENDVAPTCDVAGSYDTVVYCSVCDAELSRVTTTVHALGHKYGDWIIDIEPSPDTEGWMHRECERCGNIEETVAKHNHVYEMYLEEPTCTEWGCEYYYCIVPGCEFGYTNYLPELGHKYEVTETTAPSCMEKGHTVYTCANCGDSYTTEDVIGQHEITDFNEGFDASCLEDGIIAYWYCGTCNTYFADAELTTKLEDQTGLNLVIPATGHNITSFSEGMEASCLEEGLKAYWYCGDCNVYFADAELTTKMEDQTGLNLVIPVTGHNITSFSEGFDATCTEPGLMAYWYCGDCGTYFANADLTEKLEDQTGNALETPVFGHKYDEQGNCTICGEPEPTEPTEPTVPTVPTVPTEPTQPGETTEPTVPTEPTQPGEGQDPSDTGDAVVMAFVIGMLLMAGVSALVLKKKYL